MKNVFYLFSLLWLCVACSDKGDEQHESSNHRDNQKKNRFFLLTHNANEFPGFKRQAPR